jgi:proline iminopeptidase
MVVEEVSHRQLTRLPIRIIACIFLYETAMCFVPTQLNTWPFHVTAGKNHKHMKIRYLLLFLVCLMACEPVRERSGFADVNGTRLYYQLLGAGEPVFILHGGPLLDQSYLQDHVQGLSKEFLVVLFDQRLCGKSAGTVDSTSVTLDNYVEDIEALRRQLSFEQIHVLGHSFGALLAVRYTERYPTNVKRLILSDPIPPTTAIWQQEEAELNKRLTPYDTAQRGKVLRSESFRKQEVSAVNDLMKKSFKIQFYDTTKLDLLRIELPADYFARSQQFARIGPELMNYDLLPALRQFTLPVLVLYGDYEPAATLSGPVYKAALQQGKLVIVPQSGHFPFIEQPKAFDSLVSTFIRGN